MLIFINYPKCSTCIKAKKWLDDNNITYEDRDIKSKTPTLDELTLWTKRFNIPVNCLFNTSGVKYRELNLKERLKNISVEEALVLLSTDGMLIKRPILVCRDNILIGFKEQLWKDELI